MAVAGVATAVLVVTAAGDPAQRAHAVDREGNVGRGTGWLVTDVGRVGGAPFWAGTHVIDDGREGLCLEFGHRGPTERIDHGYREVTAPALLDPPLLRSLGYVVSTVGSRGPDTVERRDAAAAAAYAVWALAERAGMPVTSSHGIPGGAWRTRWDQGMPDGSPSPTAIDPALDPAAVARRVDLLRAGVAAVAREDGVITAALQQTADGLVVSVTASGRGLPLVPVEVVAAEGVEGVGAGARYETDGSGEVFLPVSPAEVAAQVNLVVWLPGPPRFAATPHLIDGVAPQTMVLDGEPEMVTLVWQDTPATTTQPPLESPTTELPPPPQPVDAEPTEPSPTTTGPPATMPPVTAPDTTSPATTVPEAVALGPSSTPPPAALDALPAAGSGPVARQAAFAVGLCLLGSGLALSQRRTAGRRRHPTLAR